MISIDGAHDKTSSSALAVAPPSLKPRHRLQVARVIRRPHRYHQRHSRSHTPCWPRCWWPGLCLDGALHGEVDAGHRTRSHPWRGAGHDGALRDEVVVAWPVASTLDDAVRGRGHHGEVQVAMVLSVARSRSPSPLPRRRAPWRGRGRRRPGHSPFVFAAASHGKVEANRGGRRYSLIVRAGSLGS